MSFDGRDERIADLYFIDQPEKGDPAEDGLVRYGNSDLRINVKGIVYSLISGSGLTAEQHKILRQLIHFIDEGPAEGFASGAYKEVTGTVFPTAIVWYDKQGIGRKKIVEKLITWAGPNATTIVWKIYDTSETLLATITDAITYSGIFETSRTRTIA